MSNTATITIAGNFFMGEKLRETNSNEMITEGFQIVKHKFNPPDSVEMQAD